MRRALLQAWSGFAFLFGLAVATASPASAIPVFAHRYGYTCGVCHTEVPHLTAFGAAFLANGYRIPGVKPGAAFPVSMRVETAYASAGAADPDAPGNTPLPKYIVDEVELLTGGTIGSRGSYWAEAYVVDGGLPGNARDVWAAYRATPDGARLPIVVRAGQFTLPLPLDPETFRETMQPYAIWGQTAGINPFNFFSVKQGGQIEIGNPALGLSGTAAVLRGHETASGVPSNGLDTMFTIRRDYGDWSLTAYRYDGSRVLSGLGFNFTTPIFGISDRFWRNGYGIGWSHGGTEINGVYQIGNDTAADVYNDALVTSGAFFQVRQAIGSRAFAIARWDATQDATFARTVTAGLGYAFTKNTRLTIFETAQRDFNGNLLHIISSSFLFAY